MPTGEPAREDVLERSVKASLKRFLHILGAYQYWPVPMGYGAKTIDCFFCYRGLFFAVECKRSSVDEPTAYQAEVLRQVAAAQGGTCVENDPELPSVKAMLHAALRLIA